MRIDYENGKNKLIYGDNLTIMQEMPRNCIDLIYLDPPFNSNRNYNMMYKTMTGYPVPEQAEAFCDMWTLDSKDIEKLRMIRHTLESYELDSDIIDFWDNWLKALRTTNEKLLSYLFYMMERLFEMRRILKPTGSIYLHCDPTASHYIKVMMDGVFGHSNFRNEIVWQRREEKHNLAKYHMGKSHDVILFYAKNENSYYEKIYTPYREDYIKDHYNHKDDIGYYSTFPATNEGGGNKLYEFKGITRAWRFSKENMEKLYNDNMLTQATTTSPFRYKKYLKDAKGIPLDDCWLDIKPIRGKSSLGYPTQKPIALLERIIKASCPIDGVVFDPFCGCGTTIYATQKLNLEQRATRKWIGCDIAVLSTRLIKDTLELGKKPLMNEPLKQGVDFELCGYPMSVEGAQLLFEKDPKQFEHWAVEWVGGFINKKQSGDKGIDGRIYFEKKDKELGKMLISVKGGKHITPSMVRELKGTMEREKSEFASLILTIPPTKGMIEEASQTGQYEFNGIKYDRIQILTTKEMTEDKKIFNLPNRIGNKHKDNQLEMYL